MIPQTIGREYDIGKVAPVQCIKNDTLRDINIQGNCFLLLIVHTGTVRFQIGNTVFTAVAPCFVCFDERKQPKPVKKSGFRCDSVYFHPRFLNVNMSFERVHGGDYEQVATSHDMFLLKPFTDEEQFVFPIFDECADQLDRLFAGLEIELREQRDWYWSCRSRSYFMEIILMLERAYGIIGQDKTAGTDNRIRNPHVKTAVIYIESHYSEDISLESITKAASLNHSTLTQLFKEYLHVTAMEYLWQYRIAVAKKYLAFTNLPIKDIARRCGFKTVQHFSRKFREATGTTAANFRDTAVAKRKAAF